MTNKHKDMQSYLSIFCLRRKRYLGMEITALKSKIQDSKAPQETWARKEMNTSLTGNYTAGPFWCARIVAATIVSSNGTTFVKAPKYKEASRDEKWGDKEKKAIYHRHSSRSNLHHHHHHSHSYHL